MSKKVALMIDLGDQQDELDIYAGDTNTGKEILEWFVRCLMCRGNAQDFSPQEILTGFLTEHLGESFIYSEESSRIFDIVKRSIEYRLPKYSPFDVSGTTIKTYDISMNPIGFIIIKIPEPTFRRWVGV